MASVGYRRGGWELRCRDNGGRQRVERFPAPEGRRRPPEAALDRKAEVERELRRGSYVAREEREVTFGVYYERWLASRQISSSRAYPAGPRWNEAIGVRRCDLNPLRQEITFGKVVVNGTHPLRANVGRDVLRKAVHRAGLQRHVTWLTLRHTAASLMFDAGLTLFEVQHRLGHKSPTMTAEVYTHLMRERFDEGRKRMEDDMLAKRRTEPSDATIAWASDPRCDRTGLLAQRSVTTRGARRARVDLDRVGEVPDPDAALGEIANGGEGVADGAAKPVRGAHDDHIAIPVVGESRV